MPYAVEKFKALGTEITICAEIAEQPDAVLRDIKKMFRDFERQFSRFNPASELSLLNCSGGRAFAASRLMTEILTEARAAHEKTSGLFDPCVLPVLECLGYDKNFDDLAETADPKPQVAKIACGDFSKIQIDRTKRTIKVPRGARIDLGGIGKGFVVDLAAHRLRKYVDNFWISAGGDMVFSGSDGGKNWNVGVQNPLCHEKDIINVEVPEARPAVATSGITKRKWNHHGKTYHHIIDPRTGWPVENNLLAATVFAEQAVWADVWAKSILILGVEAGLDLANHMPTISAILIDKNLHMYLTDNMKPSTRT